jgi:hypothetical protein
LNFVKSGFGVLYRWGEETGGGLIVEQKKVDFEIFFFFLHWQKSVEWWRKSGRFEHNEEIGVTIRKPQYYTFLL